ncbi:putative multidrug resistance protein NorM [Longispora fulva]|uniref:Probable multidrug resistance protein NorM n=1 Tax=Longispora fulva TaxID=619741 RepID=A0A8J7GGV0_9ACTN|nr:MATE family efflux transporter [Longispora fulva]MBG6136477.1 MATE family multidrug resistance protein [Longispora fulva]GIG59646.1 putative multidrug resistance protein NorM [Longispora fulva]
MSFATDSRRLLALAVPIALTQLAQVALTTTDTVMMGLLGTRSLAAGGLAIVLFNQLRTMGVGMVTAVGNQVAAATARASEMDGAAGRPGRDSPGPAVREKVRDLVRAALVLATTAGIIGALLMVGCGRALVWLGQDPDVVRAARPILLALAPGLVPCLWFQVIRQYTVGMRRPSALVWITVVSIAVNAALNWGFIHGTAGLPRLGLAGIGLATSSVYVATFAALYTVTRRDAVLAPMLSLRLWRARPATIRRLAGLGAPIAATYGSEAGFFSVVALLIGSLGASALAAHTVVNQLVYIVFQVTVGLSHAASISVSQEIARGRVADAGRAARTALTHGAILLGVLAVVYLAVPDLVLRPFLDPADHAATTIAVQLLAVAAVLQFADSAQNIAVGLLRGLDDTKAGFRMTLVGYWAVGLPVAWLIGRVLLPGAVGVWIGLATGLTVTAVLLLRRFHRALAARVESVAIAG